MSLSNVLIITLYIVFNVSFSLGALPPRSRYGQGEAFQDQKPCIFIHGSGVKSEGGLERSFPEYWGNILAWTYQCSDSYFLKADTLHRSYADRSLQEEVCGAMTLGVGSVVDNVVIFTHSMGGLVVANALLNNVCFFGPNVSWYAAATPWRGSQVATVGEKLCATEDPVLQEAIKIIGGVCCNYGINEERPCPPYVDMEPSSPKLVGLIDIGKKYVKGQMCGSSAVGLVSRYSAPLSTLALFAHLETPDDGLVSFASCDLGRMNSENPNDLDYAGPFNHADSTCRNGNGDISMDRMPCSWFAYKM